MDFVLETAWGPLKGFRLGRGATWSGFRHRSVTRAIWFVRSHCRGPWQKQVVSELCRRGPFLPRVSAAEEGPVRLRFHVVPCVSPSCLSRFCRRLPGSHCFGPVMRGIIVTMSVHRHRAVHTRETTRRSTLGVSCRLRCWLLVERRDRSSFFLSAWVRSLSSAAGHLALGRWRTAAVAGRAFPRNGRGVRSGRGGRNACWHLPLVPGVNASAPGGWENTA